MVFLPFPERDKKPNKLASFQWCIALTLLHIILNSILQIIQTFKGSRIRVKDNYLTTDGPECQKPVAIIRSVDKVDLHLSPLDPWILESLNPESCILRRTSNDKELAHGSRRVAYDKRKTLEKGFKLRSLFFDWVLWMNLQANIWENIARILNIK